MEFDKFLFSREGCQMTRMMMGFGLGLLASWIFSAEIVSTDHSGPGFRSEYRLSIANWLRGETRRHYCLVNRSYGYVYITTCPEQREFLLEAPPELEVR